LNKGVQKTSLTRIRCVYDARRDVCRGRGTPKTMNILLRLQWYLAAAGVPARSRKKNEVGLAIQRQPRCLWDHRRTPAAVLSAASPRTFLQGRVKPDGALTELSLSRNEDESVLMRRGTLCANGRFSYAARAADREIDVPAAPAIFRRALTERCLSLRITAFSQRKCVDVDAHRLNCTFREKPALSAVSSIISS